jgi:hypothetical protein
LASLLELADEGFIALRNELANYETSVPERIEHTPQEVSIDKASLIAFVSNSETAKKLDNYIASLAKATLHLNLESIARNAQKLQYFSINTIAQLQSELLQYAPEIERFAKQWFERPRSETGHGKIEKVNVGISLFYLYYIEVARKNNIEEIKEYVKHFKLGPGSPRKIAEEILNTYNKIKASI